MPLRQRGLGPATRMRLVRRSSRLSGARRVSPAGPLAPIFTGCARGGRSARLRMSPVRFKTWQVVALAMSGLLLLVMISVVATRSKAQAIYVQLEQLNDH